MGAAVSRNVAKTTVNAITKQAIEIINNTKATNDQTQAISINNVSHDVVISGNKFNQKATINTEALLKTISSQKAQQDLSLKLSQSAKSLCSDVNLFQASVAENFVNTYMNSTVELSTKISQSCSSQSAQKISVNVDTVDGNVEIKDNEFSQVSEIFSSCVNDAMASQDSMQKLQATIDQVSTATNKGVSIWGIVILALIALLVLILPILIPAAGVLVMLKTVLFPLMMVSGIILIALYWVIVDVKMSNFGFSILLKDDNDTVRCGAIPLSTSFEYASATEASRACKNNKLASAYDWKGYNIDSKGNSVKLQKPITTFYRGVTKDGCFISDPNKKDKSRIIRMPKVVLSETDPRSDTQKFSIGDVYINPKTSTFYKLKDDEWHSQSQLIDKFDGKNKFVFMTDYTAPSNSDKTYKNGDVIIKFAGDFSPYFNIYTKNNDIWSKKETSFPGYAPSCPTGPDNWPSFNTTGFKEKVKKPMFLIIGISFFIVGIFGIFISMNKSTSKVKPANKPAIKPAIKPK